MSDIKNSLSYEKVGASATKSGLHQVLKRVNPNEVQNYFCQTIPDFSGDDNFLSFVHCDGAGTKSIAAYLYFKETGDGQFFKRLAADALIMNLDDVFCLGIPAQLTLANTIARNSHLISDDVIEKIIVGYKELADKLLTLGIPLSLSGGETADCGDIVRTLVIDATMAGRIKKSNLLKLNSVKPGNLIVGLASFGKANYEDTYNSGIGSNGLTLARHAILSKEAVLNYPEVINSALSEDYSYCGKYKITDSPLELGTTIGDALSSPTRTYSPVLKKMYEEYFAEIRGVVHLTGGAHGKVLRFIKPCTIVKDNLFTPPPIFKLIKDSTNIPDEEMYRVFNMGQRMEIYCEPAVANNLIQISESFGIAAQVIGRVEHSSKDTPEVKVKIENSEFTLAI